VHQIPDGFSRVVSEVRQGRTPRVALRMLLGWFGFDRRGTRVNRYLRDVMAQESVRCAPDVEAVEPEGELTFSSVQTIVVVAPTPPAPRHAAPYPIAHLEASIAARADTAKRVTAKAALVELTIAYLAYAQMATLRAARGGLSALRRVLDGQLAHGGREGPPLSFGTWVDVTRRLAEVLDGDGPVHRASAAMVRGTRNAVPLGARIADIVVSRRNKIAHTPNLSDAWYREAEASFDRVSNELRDALEPLLACDLILVHDTNVGRREAYRFDVRVLHGVSNFFPLRSIETSARLAKQWASLVLPDGEVLGLAPGIYCIEDGATGRVDLYYARTLALEPGHTVRVQAIDGDATRSVPLPD
jgi:hypothetical protein